MFCVNLLNIVNPDIDKNQLSDKNPPYSYFPGSFRLVFVVAVTDRQGSLGDAGDGFAGGRSMVLVIFINLSNLSFLPYRNVNGVSVR